MNGPNAAASVAPTLIRHCIYTITSMVCRIRTAGCCLSWVCRRSLTRAVSRSTMAPCSPTRSTRPRSSSVRPASPWSDRARPVPSGTSAVSRVSRPPQNPDAPYSPRCSCVAASFAAYELAYPSSVHTCCEQVFRFTHLFSVNSSLAPYSAELCCYRESKVCRYNWHSAGSLAGHFQG